MMLFSWPTFINSHSTSLKVGMQSRSGHMQDGATAEHEGGEKAGLFLSVTHLKLFPYIDRYDANSSSGTNHRRLQLLTNLLGFNSRSNSRNDESLHADC